jgi:hypothetical protein
MASDRDQCVDTGIAKQADEFVGAIDLGPRPVVLLHGERSRVAAVGAPEDRSTEVSDAAHQISGELDRSTRRIQLGEHQPVEPVADADRLPPPTGGRQGRSPDDRVQPRRITTTGRYRNPHRT